MLSSSFNSPPVNRIPYEIFRTIIQYAYTAEPPQGEDSVLHEPLLIPPLAVSHVCRSWRKALLDDPTMWSTLLIPTFKSCGIVEFLRRSEATPLKVSICLCDNPEHLTSITSTFLSIIFQEIHRFKFLQVEIHPVNTFSNSSDSRSRIQHLLTCLQLPAQNLETFLFNNREIVLESICLETLFSGDAPNLKSISHSSFDNLWGVMACPQGPVFRNLSKLSLFLPHRGTNLNHFLDLLNSSPCLTMLYIHNSLRGYTWSDESLESPGQPERTVSLPHLQYLVLKTSPLVKLLDFFLRHVKIPPNVQWHIASCPTTPVVNSSSGRELGIHQFLSKARFTSAHITISIDDYRVDLILIEDTGKNQFTFQYTDHGHFKRHWYTVLAGFIDASRIAHLQLTVSSYSLKTVKDALCKVRHLFDESDSVFGHLAPQCTVIGWDRMRDLRYEIASPWKSEGKFSFQS